MTSEEFSYEIKIPKERVAVLIGKGGETKKDIEESTSSYIDVDSKEGDVIIKGPDSLKIFTALNVVRAIGRGFNPDIALLLLKSDYSLELLNISDYVGKSTNKTIRFKGRIIGKEGKSRQVIEELSETYISVYGKTVGIIGMPENVSAARRAIESLLGGAPHSHVYKWLEKRRTQMKIEERSPF
jgi:ribosomal RNA assembly protein